MSGADFADKKTVRLTTRGRSSGQPRTVSIWFVADGPRRILVQHVTSAPANWYRNLLKDPAVSIDFGSGPISARATPITDPQRVQHVLGAVRGKYWSAWLIQLFGRKSPAVAAEISWGP
jgi:deazaflavin-dependent oxidoreductase (nitroreductase family)